MPLKDIIRIIISRKGGSQMDTHRIVIMLIGAIVVFIEEWLKQNRNIKAQKTKQPSKHTKKYNREFEYREISAKRCREVNRMCIRDLSAPGNDMIFLADGKTFVTNKDETLLCYRFILPGHNEEDENKADVLFIKEMNVYHVTIELDSYDEMYGSGNLLEIINHTISKSASFETFVTID